MTEEQYQSLVAFFAEKVAKLNAVGDNDESEPWHITAKALALPEMKDYPPNVRVAAIGVEVSQLAKDAGMVYRVLGLTEAAVDQQQALVISLILEAALTITEVKAVVTEEAIA